ncbi:hypothetical protein C1Y63_11340 [Corynebacterium sp. 13CS0277]|uniref:hypothetical protein n=1 Tax=Corynebacterium sp. 13CS0277 TaxID=2071994 RepID=UPI000D028047|nr:hypothetical protein [Corynebacterium sp. 13CS0277]PRQ10474.1 hypothetical protein C1Y63_11340 [Corynebacterium sp. 13CS0277]
MPPEIRIPGLPPLKPEDIGRALATLLSLVLVFLGLGGTEMSSQQPNSGDQVVVVTKPGSKPSSSEEKMREEIANSLKNEVRNGGSASFYDNSLANDAQNAAKKAAKDKRLPSSSDTLVAFYIKKEDNPTAAKFADKLKTSKPFTYDGTINFGVGVASNDKGTYVVLQTDEVFAN